MTDLGEQQAAALPLRLAGEHIDGVWSSRALRARQTAAPLAEALGRASTTLPGMHEIQAGDLEMSTDRDAWLAYVGQLERWIRGDPAGRLPGGESAQEALDRVDADLATVAASGAQHAAVVAHGALIRVWTALRVPSLDRDFVVRSPMDNTGYVVVDGAVERGWELVAWRGDLPPEPLDPIAEPDTARRL